MLREGIDIPVVSHAILATVMALQSFLQSMGRILRAYPGKERATAQDHGGHWHRHGSANMDREWNLSWTEHLIQGVREDQFREKQQPEPIHCPQCGLIRRSGAVCPTCGHESKRKSRMVIQRDGRLKEHVGDIYKARHVRMTPDTQRFWDKCYYRSRNSKNCMTFRQAEGLFVSENGYFPPRSLKRMPRETLDFFKPVADVPAERLI